MDQNLLLIAVVVVVVILLLLSVSNESYMDTTTSAFSENQLALREQYMSPTVNTFYSDRQPGVNVYNKEQYMSPTVNTFYSDRQPGVNVYNKENFDPLYGNPTCNSNVLLGGRGAACGYGSSNLLFGQT